MGFYYPTHLILGELTYKRLTIRGFEALAVEALRELDEENRVLRAELEALRMQQADLLQRLERVEALLTPSADR